ncbi:MAG: NAD(P)/FAD-dependent oxidoreductase [Anaerolineae bacterium]|nr:NAD(P)/FAD-dependent oxidoreductase [Anaerolineae bacterium]
MTENETVPSPAMRYVIIGNGMAGITAAQESRRVDPYGKITLIGDEGESYYYRASLSAWIAGDITDAMLPGRGERFYRDMHIKQVTGHVARVDPEAKMLEFEDGSSMAYDRLLIASGARANTVVIEGLETINVLRSWTDARAIKARLESCKRALILGGGVLGLELAGAFKRVGSAQIAIVEQSAFVGGSILDASSAAWLQARLRADGIALFLNDTVARVEGNTAHLAGGETWEFDLCVQAVGVMPIFPDVPGMEVGCGIRINEAAHTNLRDIYAAGDCTEIYNTDQGRWVATRNWRDCARQARVAARNMASSNPLSGVQSLTMQPVFNGSVLYDVAYVHTGNPHDDGGAARGDVYLWQRPGAYRKVRVVDGKLAGALLLQQVARPETGHSEVQLEAGHNKTGYSGVGAALALHCAIGADVARYGDAVARPDFPWNDVTGMDWDYVFY